ncbi:MAG TPA: hypothetical protein RMH99_17070 [Sandaracinaceae bacterium LLY-WYZ-13_1]|nr:hypothetical protein [Sandaracinaceae bacterium LLY-WYZ-13_1]
MERSRAFVWAGLGVLLLAGGCEREAGTESDAGAALPDAAHAGMDGGPAGSDAGEPACAEGPESTAEACSDGCSNDGDDLVDCDDFDCDEFCAAPCDSGPESTAAACSDGCSNDGDRFVDCDDFDCDEFCADGTDAGTPDGGPTGPPDVDFAGGTLEDLRAESPSLEFGRLRIDGGLRLDPGDASFTLDVEELEITGAGSITYAQSECSYRPAPDVSIVASGAVLIAGRIDLSGKRGSRTTTSASCRSCSGVDGGALLVEGDTIEVDAAISTRGGAGSQLVLTGGSIGCDGGDGGDLLLRATNDLTATGAAALVHRGGEGGPGSLGDGSDGRAGDLEWTGYPIDAVEIEPNGGPESMYVPSRWVTIRGHVSETDSASASRPFEAVLPSVTDRIEDLYSVSPPSSETGLTCFTLRTDSSTTDLDLHLFRTRSTRIESSTSSGGYERVSFEFTSSDRHIWVGVSWCCDTPPSDYTLTIEPCAGL